MIPAQAERISPGEAEQAAEFEAAVQVSSEGCIIFLNRVESKLAAGLWRFSPSLLDYHF